MPPKKKIIKLGSKKKPATAKQFKAARKKVLKRKPRATPHDMVMAKFKELVPAMAEATGDALESWTLFAHKLLLAKRMKTTVFTVTVNPLMLEHREVLQKEFGCSIMSPTEARFGMDSIEKF
jgi:hypothetical protein